MVCENNGHRLDGLQDGLRHRPARGRTNTRMLAQLRESVIDLMKSDAIMPSAFALHNITGANEVVAGLPLFDQRSG
jgi:hypothetical protein